jgi:predicted SnoaL-like aldol condensation-catalyzing enzyme
MSPKNTNVMDGNKALALAGIKGVFIDRDPTILDRLFSADYKQHNPQIANGTPAINALLGSLPASFKYEPGLVVAEGDYVTIHGRYIGWRPNGGFSGQSANGNSMLTSSQT